ncbi:MAG TPA: tetratricopeptide repeat protein, partial [Candidatus Dormibacteraeota bacterium]|nr:tetratricopeptide repeat protein [Candidatus Dormibacteraeota bacterium]
MNELLDDRQSRHGLWTLTRIAQREPAFTKDIARVLDNDLERQASRAIAVAQQAGDPIGVVLAGVLRAWLPAEPSLVALGAEIPLHTVSLREAAHVLAAAEVEATERTGRDEDRARARDHLSIRLSALGRPEEALAVKQEAVEIHRRLAEAAPDAFLPGLAACLNGLSNRLGDLGRHEEALAAGEQAVELHRRLARERPGSSLLGLAASLSNLGNRLGMLGRRDAMLAPTAEAVELRRRLVATSPDAHLPGLAGSLHNLSIRLGMLGRREEARAVSQEAVEIHRELADGRPDAFRPALASALRTLGNRLAAVGRREEALA